MEDSKPFVLSKLRRADTSVMEVMEGGSGTSWLWTFSGPSHPRSLAQKERIEREDLRKRAAIEQAQVNGKKYKSDVPSPKERRDENIDFVLERLLGWSDVVLDEDATEPFAFTPENARGFLHDEEKGGPAVLLQCIDFLLDEKSFTTRSAKS